MRPANSPAGQAHMENPVVACALRDMGPDGTPVERQLRLDLAAWIPELRKEGLLLFDDVSWETLTSARDSSGGRPGRFLIGESTTKGLAAHRIASQFPARRSLMLRQEVLLVTEQAPLPLSDTSSRLPNVDAERLAVLAHERQRPHNRAFAYHDSGKHDAARPH